MQRDTGQGYSRVWVEAFRRATCGDCAAQDSCGQGVLGRWFARKQRQYSVHCDPERASLLAVGQWVEIAIPDGALVKAALLAYFTPIAGLLTAALVGESMALPDWAVALCGAAGFYAGFSFARSLAIRGVMGHSAQPTLLGNVNP